MLYPAVSIYARSPVNRLSSNIGAIKPKSVNSETTYRADLKTYYREVELILHPATISALVWLLVADSHVTAWYRGAGGM